MLHVLQYQKHPQQFSKRRIELHVEDIDKTNKSDEKREQQWKIFQYGALIVLSLSLGNLLQLAYLRIICLLIPYFFEVSLCLEMSVLVLNTI